MALGTLTPVDSGVSLADLTVAALTGQPEANYKKTVQTKATFYDKTTISGFVPWDARIAKIG